MADVKWIKITTDIFDDEKILLIESLPDAYAIITVWFKLLCLAGKQNNSGVFMLGRMPYTDGMLATIFRMKEATVTMALKTFEQFGMIEIVDGVITIPKWEKHQSLDKLELAKEQTRQRVARHRARQKQLAEKTAETDVALPVTECNADVTPTDIDTDKDKEQDKDNTIIGKADGEPAKVTEADIEEEFEALWELYPRKEGKKTAFATYKRVRTRKKKPVTYEQVRDGIVAYATACKGTERKYIKQGSTWFNGECWNDELTGGNNNGGTQAGNNTGESKKPSWAGNVL